ncbi:MAG: nitroreductase [Verrucomicrobiales bacterium]|nr:nitroreductase [Verrucomicrobiales bacterium]
MEVLEAIRGRASVRAFLDQPVTRETIRGVLDAAKWSPSGGNTQPWQVAVVTGETKREIGDRMVAAYRAGEEGDADYQYYAKRFPEPYRGRRYTCGMALYSALGIERSDKPGRRAQWEKNYHGFDAPVELFIFVDDALEMGSWVDTGMFIQNVMLAARAFGLETCPQAALAEYPGIVREVLDLPDSMKLVCGIAMGYPEPEAAVNGYRTEREDVDGFTRWYGDD